VIAELFEPLILLVGSELMLPHILESDVFKPTSCANRLGAAKSGIYDSGLSSTTQASFVRRICQINFLRSCV